MERDHSPSSLSKELLQRKKAFERWLSAQLKVPESEVDIYSQTEFLLMRLMKTLYPQFDHEIVESKDEEEKMKNIHYVFGMLVETGVDVSCMNPKAIIDGEEKSILQILWMIIENAHLRHYLIQDQVSWEAKEAKKDGKEVSLASILLTISSDPNLNEENVVEELFLKWCQARVEEYQTIQIENFDQSFVDGKAFVALIHSLNPQMFDFDELIQEKRISMLQKVFEIGETKYGIKRFIDLQDFEEEPPVCDSQAIMTYLSQLVLFSVEEGKLLRDLDEEFSSFRIGYPTETIYESLFKNESTNDSDNNNEPLLSPSNENNNEQKSEEAVEQKKDSSEKNNETLEPPVQKPSPYPHPEQIPPNQQFQQMPPNQQFQQILPNQQFQQMPPNQPQQIPPNQPQQIPPNQQFQQTLPIQPQQMPPNQQPPMHYSSSPQPQYPGYPPPQQPQMYYPPPPPPPPHVVYPSWNGYYGPQHGYYGPRYSAPMYRSSFQSYPSQTHVLQYQTPPQGWVYPPNNNFVQPTIYQPYYTHAPRTTITKSVQKTPSHKLDKKSKKKMKKTKKKTKGGYEFIEDEVEVENDQPALPPGWEVRLDRNRRPYYVDHNTRTTSYTHPFYNLKANALSSNQKNYVPPHNTFDDPEAHKLKLPPGWESRLDKNGRRYYIDHNTKTTTFDPPPQNK